MDFTLHKCQGITGTVVVKIPLPRIRTPSWNLYTPLRSSEDGWYSKDQDLCTLSLTRTINKFTTFRIVVILLLLHCSYRFGDVMTVSIDFDEPPLYHFNGSCDYS